MTGLRNEKAIAFHRSWRVMQVTQEYAGQDEIGDGPDSVAEPFLRRRTDTGVMASSACKHLASVGTRQGRQPAWVAASTRTAMRPATLGSRAPIG